MPPDGQTQPRGKAGHVTKTSSSPPPRPPLRFHLLGASICGNNEEVLATWTLLTDVKL